MGLLCMVNIVIILTIAKLASYIFWFAHIIVSYQLGKFCVTCNLQLFETFVQSMHLNCTNNICGYIDHETHPMICVDWEFFKW